VLILGYILIALLAYLLGSIPTGFLVGKSRGLDIRAVGSGNIGATNVFRILGVRAGTFVLLIDALKGWVAVGLMAPLLISFFNGTTPSDNMRESAEIVAAACAVVGHNYTCWLNFKGGKGIATSAGVLLALVSLPLIIILSVWVIVFALSRYVSLASILAAFTLPFATWITGHSLTLIIVTAALTVMAIYKHKANIRRLIDGTENRFRGKKSRVNQNQPKPAL
jgi:acyl phosphate:glycerol-3-phosphate acyltransferase